MQVSSSYHQPVLLEEVMTHLNIKPGGTYVDLTFGGGGHAKVLLKDHAIKALWAFDQDPDAREQARQLDDPRLHFIQGNFRFFSSLLKVHGVDQVDGVFADLGVSSHQFDTASRGFSVRLGGPLDMRMHGEGHLTAAHLINTYHMVKLAEVLAKYGDIRSARKIAQHLVDMRKKNPFTSIDQLKEALKPFLPRGKEYKFYAKVFQALRMEVNDEVGALHDMLEQLPTILSPGGRFVVITYHEGEDRPVKHFLKTGSVTGEVKKDFYGHLIRPLTPLFNRVIKPSVEEIGRNNRARSARLRAAERPS